MNCATPTFRPYPRLRAAMPKAEEDLLLPLPVSTSSRPFSRVASAMWASTTAFLRCMRSRWRSFSEGSGTDLRPVRAGCAAGAELTG